MDHKYYLGIELGSTRIKSVLINDNADVVSQGSYEWENKLVDGLWSYSLDAVERGIQSSYASLTEEYEAKYNEKLTKIESIGISAMMHGYLAFDEKDSLLTPFRTWRNTNTGAAAAALTELFDFNIPMRWSVAHYYQAVLNGEEHSSKVSFLTTLAGYVHYRLTGRKVLGIGDASGMFPTDTKGYNKEMLAKFDSLLASKGINKHFADILPEVLLAGECAGVLTDDGAKFLDPTCTLMPGAITCPPEGDVGTGMVATNSTKPRTANVSAGTSAFLMVVLEKELSRYYPEIDVVATPAGAPTAMVHVNNFTTEITAWTNLFEEVIALGGGNISRSELFNALYSKSAEGDSRCGDLMGYNFIAGEPVVGVENGTSLMTRSPEGILSLANFMKMQIYSALGSLAIGCEMLKKEQVAIDSVCGHGGFFKTPKVGQSAMSAAIGAPVTIMTTAAEGGAWGIAVLALFATTSEKNLDQFLAQLFSSADKFTLSADESEKSDFSNFIEKYKKGIQVQKLAAEVINYA